MQYPAIWHSDFDRLSLNDFFDRVRQLTAGTLRISAS